MTLKAESGTIVQGEDVINLTNSDDMSGVSSGALVFVGAYPAEALRGTQNTITLSSPWPFPTTSGGVVVFNTMDQLNSIASKTKEASNALKGITASFYELLTSTQQSVAVQLTPTTTQEIVPYGYLAQQLQNKIDQITALEDLVPRVQKLENEKYLIGDGTPGSRRLNIFQQIIPNGVDFVSEVEKPENWTPTSNNLYLHFNTGLNTTSNNELFYFEVKIYGYTGTIITTEIVSGYSNVAQNDVINVGIKGNLDTVIYRAPNGDVYFRIKADTLYYWTITIDTMNIFESLPEKDSLSLTISPSLNLASY